MNIKREEVPEHWRCNNCQAKNNLVCVDMKYAVLCLCPDCVASLHSLLSPLSVLVQTGIDTEQ